MVPSVQLIRGKLYRPHVAADYVKRPRLLDRLNTGLGQPVTLVAAPAGFGKSSLLANWLDTVPLPSAWLTLDQDDNDLRLYSAYLIAAIQTVFPGGLQVSTGMTNGGPLPEPVRLALSLSNDIDELPSEFVLVLDDYHTIRDPAVTSLMSALVRHLPVQLHLVFASRTDSPLPFSRLRGAGRLCELRARDLRFSLDETTAFLQQSVDGPLTTDTVQQLQTRLEGWAVGLRFASMLLQEDANPQTLIENLITGSRRPLMGYILEEVLANLRPAVRELVLKTSLLDRFTAGICDSLSSNSSNESGSRILQELLENDIVLEIPGDTATWFRYHALFAEFLRAHAHSQYSQETIANVHKTASDWFNANGMITEAIQQEIEAGDIPAAAQIVYRNLHSALNREAGRTLLENWLGLFPVQVLEQQLELMIARIWLAGIQFRLNAVPGLVSRAQQLFAQRNDLDPAQRRVMQAEINGYRPGLYQWRNEPQQAIELGDELAANLPAEAEFGRASNLTEIVMAEQMLGNSAGALERLTGELRADISPLYNRRVMLSFWAVYVNDGNLTKAADAAETLLRMSKESSPISMLWARFQLGVIHYEWNHLEIAVQHYSAAAELVYQGNGKAAHESLAFLAKTQFALGRADASAATMQELLRFTEDLQSGEFEYHAATHRAAQALWLGKIETALQWAQSVILNPRPHMLFEIEPNLIRLDILLATRNSELIGVMLKDTEALLEVATSLHSTRRVIHLLALKALGRDALGNHNGALETLHESVRLAEPGGFLRTFLDRGPRMTLLLNQLLTRMPEDTFLRQLVNTSPHQPRARASKASKPPLIEPLTNRELQVLERLALRLTDKEIAQALVISPLTVKAHTDHIYQKLGVNNRQEAVQVGVAVGILDRTPGTLFSA